MREGLLTAGIILLVLGAIFYFMPAATSTPAASVSIVRNLSLVSMILGAMLTILGIVLPNVDEAKPEQNE